MERDVAEERPVKRRGEGRKYSDTESDSGYHSSYHTSSGEVGDYPDYQTMMLEDMMPWTKNDLIPASYIEALECQMLTTSKTDTEWVECSAGI
eukprot:541863-Heterocapsa_arctica.AAC.1